MSEKFKLVLEFEHNLTVAHPDAPIHSVDSMSAHSGKSRRWIIEQWKAGRLHAYEWGSEPADIEISGSRRGLKICLSTHPDSLDAAVQRVDAETKSRWRKNADRLNGKSNPTVCGASSAALYIITKQSTTPR